MLSSPVVALAVQIIQLVLARMGAKAATLEAFQKLVEAAKDDGLVAVETRDVFLSQKAALDKMDMPKS